MQSVRQDHVEFVTIEQFCGCEESASADPPVYVVLELDPTNGTALDRSHCAAQDIKVRTLCIYLKEVHAVPAEPPELCIKGH
jgi:hypothetical protein